MIEYSKFDEVTGRIIQSGRCQLSVFPLMSPAIEGAYDDTKYYIVDYLPELRPSLTFDKLQIQSNSEDCAIATGLPIPFSFLIDGVEYTCTDGTIEFCVDIPGIYNIQALTFPYTDEIITIEAI